MAVILPFCGLRYNSEKFSDLASVTAPPNETISEEYYQQLCDKSEYNIARLGYCEKYNETPTEELYQNSNALLKAWVDDGILLRDTKPSIYIYEQRFVMKNNLQSLKGIICLVKIEDYDKKVILPHQKSSKHGTKHPLNLLRATKANISPIFSLYNDSDISISSIIVANSSKKPDVTFETEEGITQNLWLIEDEDTINQLQECFKDKQLFLADGHHRYASCLKYKNEMHEKEKSEAEAYYDFTMMAIMPMYSSGLFVLPTHRLVREIEHFDENILINMLTEDFKVSRIHFTSEDYDKVIIDRISDVIDEKYFGLYTGGDYYYLLKPHSLETETKKNSEKSSTSILKSIEANLLNTSILEKHLGISKEDLEENKFISYTRSAEEAIHQVQIGNYQCAFFLNSTRVDELRCVAEAGKMMPLKSTFFWPKTITGLVINSPE